MQNYGAILEKKTVGKGVRSDPITQPLASQSRITEPEGRVSKAAPNLWPPESLDDERRFGICHARLFSFVERRVWTPVGTGKLFTAHANHCEIVLDGTNNVILVRTEDVRPIQ